MNMSRFGLSAGVAMLLAGPLLAQSAEPPAGSTPPAPAPAGAETPPPQPTTPPTDHGGHDMTTDKASDTGKDGKDVPKPQ
jgi:hypothetical protein